MMLSRSRRPKGLTAECPCATMPHPGNVPGLPGVYRLLHLKSGKCYIGSATDCCRRFLEHQADLADRIHGNRGLQAAYNMNGPKGITFTVLEVFTLGQADEVTRNLAEQRWIDRHQPEVFNYRPAGSDWYLKETQSGRRAVQAAGMVFNRDGKLTKKFKGKGW